MGLKFLQPKEEYKRLHQCEGQTAEINESGEIYAENDLVRRTRKGDVGAFEELFNRHQKRIYSIAMHMLQNEWEAADATQDVFVKAFQCIGTLKADAAFVTWLKTLTVNQCRDLLRKRTRTRTESLDSTVEREDGSSTENEIADSTSDPAKLMLKTDMREVIQKAIGSLSPEHREAVSLYYMDGRDVAEIAKILQCPVGTVKCRLSRARGELKRKLACYVE